MKFDFTGLCVFVSDEACSKAASMFCEEILARTGVTPEYGDGKPCVRFEIDTAHALPNKDSYSLSLRDSTLTVCAQGIRGLIYGYSYFLRKTEYSGKKITLIKDITGTYIPDKEIRGHQCGYRTTPNTYDAWDKKEYAAFYRDIMMFGCNYCEHIPTEGKHNPKNAVMKYTTHEMAIIGEQLADEVDLNVSLWYPNDSTDTHEQAVAERREVFKKSPRINIVFPPGGDPGDMPGDEFVERCRCISRALKEIKPDAQMWPSAQQPHSQVNWGNDFIEAMEQLPDEIDGVITGPNRAFPLDTLRRRLPMKYPIRLYPDITHNVRCEYPVHFTQDDWHFALINGLSRECVNPRPTEYRQIHRMTSRYVLGSVSYSEGVNDDVNKFVWSDMDFFPDVTLRETLSDYARAFYYGLPVEEVVDGILGLELNWVGDPAENSQIENTLNIWERLYEKYPSQKNNWRFVMHLFRAKCDALIRRRRLFELNLVDEAVYLLKKGEYEQAEQILDTPFDETYLRLRSEISAHAEALFKLIGMQLDVEHYHADSWERGATLETIDLPVTDRLWLKKKLEKALSLPRADGEKLINAVLNRNSLLPDEYRFSLAEHGFDVLGEKQVGEFYINYQGDRPNVNNGDIPMSMLKLYDHFTFRCRLGGFLPGRDYVLTVAFSKNCIELLNGFYVKANDRIIYSGKPYGGSVSEEFTEELLAPGFVGISYTLPADVFENGCVALEIGEPIAGVMLSEFWIKRK